MPAGKHADQTRPAQSRGPGLRKVWMFSHECAGIAQAGGLGEAVAGLARTLGSDYGLKVTVLLPSHGKHLDPQLRESYSLQEETRFIAQGYRIGVNGVHYGFLSGVERGSRDNVNYILVKGLDPPTSHWLDDPVLYDHDLTFEKMALFARTTKLYCEYLLSTQRQSELPDLIHAHDWHMVPAGVAAKQHLEDRGVLVPLVFTVHLLSGITLPWHYASEDWCGIRDLPQKVRLSKGKVSPLTYRQVWERRCQSSLEKFGCYEADYVTSVSKSYMVHDVLGYVGPVVKGKSGHVYNGCDWDYEQIRSTVFAQQKQSMTVPEPASSHNRWDLRSFLLTQGIGQIADELPIDNATGLPTDTTNSQRMVRPFKTDGPMVLMTGRLSPQKGADLLLDVVPLVTRAIPDARFLLFLLPSSDNDQMRTIRDEASAYPNNVRIIFAQHRQTYLMSHMAADVYAMPSRSEPFGISALEAMVTGNPVVGSDVGGISETVLDIPEHGDRGTGILVPSEDTRALADSLISILYVMQIDEWTMRGQPRPARLASRIPVKTLAQMVSQNSTVGSKIRENCKSRVEENFRWINAGRTALERYNAAMNFVVSSSSGGSTLRG
jgi:starch synthase